MLLLVGYLNRMKDLTQSPYSKFQIRQKKLAELAIQNLTAEHPMKKGELVVAAGYPESKKRSPGQIFATKGVQQFLAEMQMTKQDMVSVVSNVIYDENATPKERLEGVRVASKLLGYEQPVKVQLQEKQQEGREKVFE
jgi:hypothetical protein